MFYSLAASSASKPSADRQEDSFLARPAGIIAVLLAGYFLVFSNELGQVWRENTFSDTDDLMRLIRVKALLNGDGWFNLIEPRINPPEGAVIHWPHLLDAPIVIVLKTLELLFPADTAEKVARILWPAFLFAATLGLIARTACRLHGPSTMFVTSCGFLLSVAGAAQFAPGRLDHHNVQILLAALVTLSLIRANERHWHAATAAVGLSVSLGLNLENLPFIAAIGLVFGIHGIWVGGSPEKALRTFCFTAAVALPLVYLAMNGRWGDFSCDALSRPNTIILAGLTASAGFVAWSRIQSQMFLLPGFLTVIGTLILARDYAAHCQSGPLAAVDPSPWRFGSRTYRRHSRLRRGSDPAIPPWGSFRLS
jgi:hypothetical protein